MFLAGHEWKAENNDWVALEMDSATRSYSIPSILHPGLLNNSSVSNMDDTWLRLLRTHIVDNYVCVIWPVQLRVDFSGRSRHTQRGLRNEISA